MWKISSIEVVFIPNKVVFAAFRFQSSPGYCFLSKFKGRRSPRVYPTLCHRNKWIRGNSQDFRLSQQVSPFIRIASYIVEISKLWAAIVTF
jgi:hypothetical protein